MSAWHFYRLADGGLTGRTFSGPQDALSLNLPDGCGAIDGHFDPQSQRVNLATGLVEDWQPPAPPDTELLVHYWDAGSKRWLATPTLAALKLRVQAPVMARIDQVEAGQPRALREAALATTDAAREAAQARLRALDTEIAIQRQRLAAIDAAASAEALEALLAAHTDADS